MHAAATRELPKVDKGDYGAIVRSIAAAFRYRPSDVRIELDGDRTIEAKVVAVAVANGPYMGPGLPVAPEASLEDGLFDVRVFLPTRSGELLTLVASIVRGRRRQQRRSFTERASRVASRAGDRSRRAPTPWTWARPRSCSRSDRRPSRSWLRTHRRHRRVGTARTTLPDPRPGFRAPGSRQP